MENSRTITILKHEISYWYEVDQEIPEHEIEHIQEMIIEGYSSGELNCYSDDESVNSGWWEIS